MNEQSVNQFLLAIGERRFEDLKEVLVPESSLRWITPGGAGQQTGIDPVVDTFRKWFGWLAKIDVSRARSEAIGDRFVFAYQFRVCKPDGGWYTVQQQGVLDASDDGVIAIDLVCTGFLAE